MTTCVLLCAVRCYRVVVHCVLLRCCENVVVQRVWSRLAGRSVGGGRSVVRGERWEKVGGRGFALGLGKSTARTATTCERRVGGGFLSPWVGAVGMTLK